MVTVRGGLAQTYRRFAEARSGDGRGSSLLQRVAAALAESDEAMRLVEAAPARSRKPALILAALHDLALAGLAPAYLGTDPEAAAAAAIDTLVHHTDAVVDLVTRRDVVTDDTNVAPALYPAIAEVAHRAGARSVALIDIGRPAAFNLLVDRVAITYSDGQTLGDPTSVLRRTASVVGERPVPSRAMPDVVARIAIDREPTIDVTDEGDSRWLRACVAPDDQQRAQQLEAALALAADHPPRLLRGDALDLLPTAIADVPPDALPVVTTTWALADRSLDDRLRFLQRLDHEATDRTIAWVSVEGVGVAPAVPTYGDRPASGHSVIGIATFEHARFRVEGVGRAWSRGRWVSWLADE